MCAIIHTAETYVMNEELPKQRPLYRYLITERTNVMCAIHTAVAHVMNEELPKQRPMRNCQSRHQ